jgi:hypothetical protein
VKLKNILPPAEMPWSFIMRVNIIKCKKSWLYAMYGLFRRIEKEIFSGFWYVTIVKGKGSL